MAGLPSTAIDRLETLAERLVLSPFAVTGDYRNTNYRWVVQAAGRIIYKRLFKKNQKKRPLHAPCCKIWGVEAELKAMNHLEKLFRTGKKTASGATFIHSSEDLIQHAIGVAPTLENEPWIVQLPRLAVDCEFAGRDESNYLEAFEPGMKLVFEDGRPYLSSQSSFLGKRNQATTTETVGLSKQEVPCMTDSKPL